MKSSSYSDARSPADDPNPQFMTHVKEKMTNLARGMVVTTTTTITIVETQPARGEKNALSPIFLTLTK
jgi:hypothetical protein